MKSMPIWVSRAAYIAGASCLAAYAGFEHISPIFVLGCLLLGAAIFWTLERAAR